MADGARTRSPENLDRLVTEAGGAADRAYEERSTAELLELMSAADEEVPQAVRRQREAVARAIDAIVERLRAGGRLIYAGAGTSGGLAALDARECETTFSTAPGQVAAVVAADPAAEDDRDAGASELQALNVSHADAVVGISASGRTPFVVGALERAADAGALTVALVSSNASQLADIADLEIAVVTGPEFIAGSTRLKAGSAQKLVLNSISTVSMIRLGKTFGNLMVDVAAANEKLRARVHRIVRTATGAPSEEVDGALEAADGDAKVAILALLAGVDAATARARLEQADGNVRLALRA
ncbi:MAG TPA: N-acetylmuramic acid 6-phosphate etherase [Gaiellaceae bacterium]